MKTTGSDPADVRATPGPARFSLAANYDPELIPALATYPVKLIHEIVAALAKRMTVHEFAALPHHHSTLAEIRTHPAEALAERVPAPQ